MRHVIMALVVFHWLLLAVSIELIFVILDDDVDSVTKARYRLLYLVLGWLPIAVPLFYALGLTRKAKLKELFGDDNG